MAWLSSELLTAFNALTSPATLEAAVTILQGQTTTVKIDVTGTTLRGFLYVRAPAGQPSSLERITEVANGVIASSTITPSTGYTASQVVTLTQQLLNIMNNGDNVPTSNPLVLTKVTSDLTVLTNSKLADGHGIIWEAGVITASDPGDMAELLSLTSATQNVWNPLPIVGDLLNLQRLGSISSTIIPYVGYVAP